MTELETIPWQPEAWEAEMRGRGRWMRPRGTRRSVPAGRPRRTRRPWIFGPWSGVAPWWTLPPWPPPPPPEAPAPPPEEAEPAPPPPDAAEEPPPEGEVPRIVEPAVSITWSAVVNIAAPRRTLGGVAGGGIYLVVNKDDAPIYVGETGSFAARWAGRLFGLGQLGLPQSCCPIRVYFGRLDKVNTPTRQAVEHAVIRTLMRGGLDAALANVRPRQPFRVVTGVTIRNVLPPSLAARARPMPHYANNTLTIPHGTLFEIPVG